MPDPSPFSLPQYEDFTKAFLVNHQQIVENVLKESCKNVIEAITRQTYNLMLQDGATGYSTQEMQLKKLYKPPRTKSSLIVPQASKGTVVAQSLNTKSSPTVIGNNLCDPITQELDPSPQKLWPALAAPNPNNQSTEWKSTASAHKHSLVRFEALPSLATFPSIAEPHERIGSLTFGNQATGVFLKKTKIRASLRKSILEISKDQTQEPPKVGGGVYAHFADGENMKEKLRLALIQPKYDVSSFYKTRGLLQYVARSTIFENITLFVVAFNALWISIDVDLNDATIITKAHPVFLITENAFCVYFLVELLIRFGAFQVKKNALKDRWFVFDTMMLVAMCFDTWIFPLMVFLISGPTSSTSQTPGAGNTAILKILRSCRLIRLARLLKILNALPELMVVIKGLFVATRAVSCTVILMLIIIYVFAITFRQLCSDTAVGNTYFKSVPDTMRFLLILGTAPDLEDHVATLWEEGAFYALMFLFFILIVSITIMNMLVGVLVGVVDTVACIEKEHIMVNFVKKNLLNLLHVMHEADDDDDEHITKEEFRKLIQNKSAIRCFTAMGVDVIGLVDLGDFIFQDKDSMDFAQFLDLILQLRGSNQATVKDIVDLRRFITMEFNAVLHALDLIPHDTEMFQEVSKTLKVDMIPAVPLASRSKSQMSALVSNSTQDEVGALEPVVQVGEPEIKNLDRDSTTMSFSTNRSASNVVGEKGTQALAENSTKRKVRRKTTNRNSSSPQVINLN